MVGVSGNSDAFLGEARPRKVFFCGLRVMVKDESSSLCQKGYIAMALLLGIIGSLFEHEDSPARFERVCIALYRDAEGVELVPTHKTWDRGRDARGISISTQGQALPGVLCATLSADVEPKVERDLRRLAETTATKAIIYCTSQALTEHACDKIEAKIRSMHPTVESVRILGQIQLVELGERFEDTIRRNYAAEISNIDRALFQTTTSAEPESIGLRLALITQTGDDARTLRSELTKRLVLEAIHNSSGSQSSGRLAVMISAHLHLARSLSGDYVRQILSQLKAEDLVDFQDDRAGLTPAGNAFVKAIPQEASGKLLEGRVAVRNAIKTLSGHALLDDHYERVWNSLQDGLADLFYSHGAAIVRMVGSLITGERIRPETGERVLLERIGNRILGLFTEQTQAEEVRQAVIDMFSRKEYQAFKWLTQVCTVYVMMCSLGFEALSSQQVTRVLRNFYLVADSDVIISLLCDKEANHEDVDRVLRGWRALGGKLYMATPVLEEVAYHAWISEHEYTSTREFLDQLTDERVENLIGNAFVRTFKHLSPDIRNRKNWLNYISQYRGSAERDYSRIMEVLNDEYSFAKFPEVEDNHKEFADQVAKFLSSRASEDAGCAPADLDYRLLDKCRRDGLLVGKIKAARDSTRQSGARGTTIILSSARLLKEADEVFRNDLGDPDAVVSTAGLGTLLTLAPGISMGLETVRGVLFDLGLATRLTRMEQYVYRLMAASGQYDLPWSKRVTLRRELGERLLADARIRGKPVRQIKERVLKSEDPQYSAKIVADALENMAVTPETERELAKAKEEIRKLREEIDALKSRDMIKSFVPKIRVGGKRRRKRGRR